VPDVRQLVGADGERAAERFLRRHHYAILHRNYRCRYGELDLVALEGTVVVFVEVKTRSHGGFGAPADAVDARKQRQIQRAAQHYLIEHDLTDRAARFDVVAVWRDGRRLQCELVRNAFDARG
jgi:putative endonuclease